MSRYALVAGEADKVANYLPGNYEVVAGNLTVFGEASSGLTLIVGEDNAGWTMDDYVLPRLGSGLYFGREVRGTEIEIVHSEAAVHTQVAGQTCHMIENDRYANGTEIPIDKRSACLVLSPDHGIVSMLKSEAGWRDERNEVRDVTDVLTAEDKRLAISNAVPRGGPGCTCGTPPFAPPEPASDCPFHSR